VSTATYTYNAYNQRTKKVTGGVTTHYVYGPGGLMLGEYTTAGVMNREYVYLNGAPLAQVTAGSPETVAYLHTDHLGTPRFATNAAGTQVWSWNNDAFGTSTPTATVTVNLRMPGQYYDAESGLFYNWNRYYNPAIGRYISSDPIGLEGGLNTFGYVGQNPVMGIDPTGEETLTLTLTGAGAQTLAQLCAANPAACLIAGPAAGLLAGYHGLGAIPGIQDAFDWWVEDDSCRVNEMSKGGKQNKSDADAWAAAQAMEGDPCKNLKKMRDDARKSGDFQNFLRYRSALKYYCRGYN
jgi:RHS repeat-associated protein